jgi:hypothetical protein
MYQSNKNAATEQAATFVTATKEGSRIDKQMEERIQTDAMLTAAIDDELAVCIMISYHQCSATFL